MIPHVSNLIAPGSIPRSLLRTFNFEIWKLKCLGACPEDLYYDPYVWIFYGLCPFYRSEQEGIFIFRIIFYLTLRALSFTMPPFEQSLGEKEHVRIHR